MAKRQRGSSTRPGQRRPAARPNQRPAAPANVRPSVSLTAAEEARAAELEAQIVAEERAAEQARSRSRDRDRDRDREPLEADRLRSRADATSAFAAKAQAEYTYVARDVRRIALIGGAMLGIMAVLYVVLEVVKPF